MQDQVNKWTPGPWQFATVREVDFRKPESEDFMIVDAEMCCIGILWGFAWKHGEPNAHLIRAAPELYDALEEALQSLEYVQNAHPEATGIAKRVEDIARAKAILAKARGAQ